MSDWLETNLGSLGKVVTGKTPSKDNPEDWGSEILFVTPSDYKNYGKYANSSIRLLSNVGAKRQANRLLPQGSILVTCIGSDMGKTAISSEPCVTNQQINAIIPNIDIANSDFIYYLTKDLYETLSSLGSDGTAVPILNKSDFENIDVSIPKLKEQKAIASVLSSLDDKIDLLHRQNTTLERMAETLFRQWFVEEAQEDWEEKLLKEVVDIGIGRTPPRQEHQWFSESETDVKWISIKDLGNDGAFIFKTSEYLTKAAIAKFNIPVIPKDTVVLSFKMTVGRVAITTEEMLSNEAIAYFKFNTKTPFTKAYLFLYLKTYKYELLGSTSSIVTSINSAMIKDMEITIPNADLMSEFQKVTEPLFEKIKTNQQQIQTLEKLRDNLLPKLMSGEVRVETEGASK